MPNESPIGTEYARTRDIIAVAVLLIALAAVLIVILVQVWPPAPSLAPDGRPELPPSATTARLPGWSPRLSRETGLFVIVLAAGMLGATVHALRSLYWYVGNRSLRRSWLMMYLFLPFIGGLLGLIVYLVLRGGLTSPAGGTSDINPYGITAIAALVGLFSQETAEKLRSVFGTLLAPAQTGRDQALPPRVDGIDPVSGEAGTTVTLRGTGLGSASRVRFGDAESPATDVTDTQVRTTVPSGAASGRPVVVTPTGNAPSPEDFTVQ
ncbi:IPT/TIG domain-containing protein [Actinomadura xylanilytica]|uniref:IPT/TIG domain-containing protein n=1 Tax=Actinomadura xylanilytica TaxID=887459 RepID=UPI00255B285F|nr:IPT/TIG domain-containing protein [Actinomadura xylanilytica]MDL4777559.1 IPT/TIG domain-containing protein [Actinomadura xylanilytica]